MTRFLGAAFLAATTTAHAFELRSSAFTEGGTIPSTYTCDGADRSPPLSWTDPPAGTKAFALVCDDPDAPAGTWTHWLIYDLPASARSLPEGVPPTPTVPGGGMQGKSSFKRTGYGGPCPPRGPAHRYFFKLLALDAPLGLAPDATREAVVDGAEKHALGRAQLMGRYARK